MMIIAVGSTNPAKVDAVKELISEHYFPSIDMQFCSIEIPSGVSEQPISLEEILRGAQRRALRAYEQMVPPEMKNKEVPCLGIGIESGLFPVPFTETGLMNICACVIYDGAGYHTGLSSAFEHPRVVMDLIDRGRTVSQAYIQAGLAEDPKLSHANGAIGMLTKGRLDRKEYIKQAVMMALIRLENKAIYDRKK